MKGLKKILVFCLLFVIGFDYVLAQDIEYLNGFTQEEYDKLLEFGFTEENIKNFNERELEYLYSVDLLNSKIETQYIKEIIYTDMTTDKVISTDTEYITKEQYKNAQVDNGIALYSGLTRAIETVNYETSYKKLTLLVSDVLTSTTDVLITVKTEWKIMPSARSYDLLAVRVTNGALVPTTQSGKYTYTYTHGNSACDMEVESTLYTEFTDSSYWTTQDGSTALYSGYLGAGVAFKLQHDGFSRCWNDISYIDSKVTEMDAWIMVKATNSYGTMGIYGTYQHATSDVNLSSIVDRYNFSSNGLGGVINFSNGMGSYYDAMQGVSMNY